MLRPASQSQPPISTTPSECSDLRPARPGTCAPSPPSPARRQRVKPQRDVPRAPQASPQTQQRPGCYRCCSASAAMPPGSGRVPLSGARVGYTGNCCSARTCLSVCALPHCAAPPPTPNTAPSTASATAFTLTWRELHGCLQLPATRREIPRLFGNRWDAASHVKAGADAELRGEEMAETDRCRAYIPSNNYRQTNLCTSKHTIKLLLAIRRKEDG